MPGNNNEDSRSSNSTDSAVAVARLRKMGDTHMIVAALVATMTFAAGLTVPGGYHGNEGPDVGLAILRKKKAFKVFFLADTLALAFSLIAISAHFNDATETRLDKIMERNSRAARHVRASMVAMLIAFISGTYSTLAPSKLAIASCVVASILSYNVVIFLSDVLEEMF